MVLADQALLSSAQLFIREDLGLSDAQIEVLAGSINVFMLASILAAGWAADVLARRGTLVLANVSLMAGELANGARRQLPRAHARAMRHQRRLRLIHRRQSSPPSTTPRSRRRPCAASCRRSSTYVPTTQP
jgi:hypothetical protein